MLVDALTFGVASSRGEDELLSDPPEETLLMQPPLQANFRRSLEEQRQSWFQLTERAGLTVLAVALTSLVSK
jgi:hypothetical protein